MNALAVWKRLLWKEFREGWLPMLAAVVVPLMLFPAASMFPRLSSVRNYLILVVEIIPLLAVALYATKKADLMDRRASMATALPVESRLNWLVSFLIPTAVMAAVGAMYGAMSLVPALRELHGWMFRGTASDAQTAMFFTVFVARAMCAWGLLFAGCFASCYLLSSATSSWAGMAVGVAWVIYGVGVVSMTSSVGGQNVAQWLWDTQRTMGELITHNAALLSAAVLGCALFAALANRALMRKRQILSFGAALAMLLGVESPAIIAEVRHSREAGTGWSYSGPYTSSTDGAFVVNAARNSQTPGEAGIVCNDLRTERTITKVFKTPIVIVCAKGPDVYLARPAGHGRGCEILIWNTRTNVVEPAAAISLDATNRFGFACASPDGRYLLIDFASKLGMGRDLWIVDIDKHRGRMIWPNSYYRMDDVAWSSDRLYVPAEDQYVRIDLTSMKARYWKTEDNGR